MAQPEAYNRTKDFTVDFQNETDHVALNAEFDGAANSINQIRANLSLIQADDGALRPQCVTREAISDDLAHDLVEDIDQYAVHINDTAIQAAQQAAASADTATAQASAAASSAQDAAESAAQFNINSYQNTILGWVKSLLFPVGATWVTFGNENPATLFDGTWTKIAAGTCLVSSGTGFNVGSSYGANTKNIAVANLPAHNHTGTTGANGKHKHSRGTMNITGEAEYYSWSYVINKSGALEGSDNGTSGGYGDSARGNSRIRIKLDASKNWTGYTSEQADHTHTFTTGNTGNGQAFNVMQSSIAVNIWRRTA